ncbi:uncharacterized protein ANIA_11323 [Aspergillus nidulans FGSC A4]|uniref:Uncharacterized protein n=1 Tax=Emericella nidulans (strain FGSC A4 / ATCC 38163 / CBS 112.46 / NRRL 194 / M139) TaxID=227321 RepID=C8VLG5_EMENI|nr:hypothetical protein [Aspergillus nidulans FGSC A4]CBF86056.1 TPA: hypothetical protein ANIA_11323 [Aspergillus nidulans FGSC A4]
MSMHAGWIRQRGQNRLAKAETQKLSQTKLHYSSTADSTGPASRAQYSRMTEV